MNRYVLKIQKTGTTKYISHLDTMRTLHRAMRRAELPITYSKGFNPHPSISFAAPLSLGVESLAEYVDIELDEIIEPSVIIEKLNKSLPLGMKVIKAIYIKDKMPTTMAATFATKYEIEMRYNHIEKVKNKIEEINNSNEILKSKRTKSGEKIVNIREMIFDLSLKEVKDNIFILECVLQTSNKGSLNPDIVSELFIDSGAEGTPILRRIEIYTSKNGKFIPLDKFYTRK